MLAKVEYIQDMLLVNQSANTEKQQVQTYPFSCY